LIFGYKARNDIRQRPGETSGERLAMASIVMGWICLVLLMLVSCGIIAYILIEALGGLKY
jgi:hypothetical protein